MKFLTFICAALFSFNTLATNAFAQSEHFQAHVYSSLVQNKNIVAPGESLKLGVLFEMEPNWHIYWKNPGDAGLPTEATWQHAALNKEGPLNYETPIPFEFGGLVNYGYKNKTLVWQNFNVSSDAKIGEEIEYTTAVSYLSCKDICLPGEAQLSYKFTIGDGASPSENANLFMQAENNQPKPAPFNVNTFINEQEVGIRITSIAEISADDISFIPARDNMIIDNETPLFQKSGENSYTVTFKKDPYFDEEGITDLAGILKIKNDAYTFGHYNKETSKSEPSADALFDEPQPTFVMVEETEPESMPLLLAFVFAIIGGLILNLMPCVLPVLSLKALSAIHHAKQEKSWMHGIVYTLGILSTFMVIGVALVTLRAGGEELGWGFQLQSPLFVAGLSLVMMLVAMQFFGAFEIGQSLTRLGGLIKGNSISSTYFSGVLMTIVATPCTAPFMAPAFGFALTQPASVTYAIFMALGFGLALPYLLLTIFPRLIKCLPKPGPWEHTFKVFLGFPMLATSLWLLWVYGNQTNLEATFILLTALLFVAFVTWIFGTISGPVKSKKQNRLALVLWVASIFGFFYTISCMECITDTPLEDQQTMQQQSHWNKWDLNQIEQDVLAGKTVFVDFTADWCITCKFNLGLALRDGQLEEYKAETGAIFYKADWTKRNDDITEELNKHGRAGVPLYLVYKNGNLQPEILPQILTESIVKEALNN